MNRYAVCILAVLLCGCIGVYAQLPYQFLHLNQSARAAALGGSFTAMSDDPAAVFINPAVLGTVEEQNFSATFLKHVSDINSGLAVYIPPLKAGGKLAVSAQFTSYGSFIRADATGQKTGQTFGGGETAIGATYSNNLDSNLYWGATAKLIYSTLAEVSSTGIGLDAGILYQMPRSRSNIGFSILNIGAQLSSYNGVSESLPLDVRLGINHRLRGLPLLVNFNFHHLGDETDDFFGKFANFSLGGELYVGKYVQLRLGYDNRMRSAVSVETRRGMSGMSAGVGIKTSFAMIDYGASSLGSAESLHRFSVGMNF
ncbi:MAG: type IX secretion system protein PorQ [Bacteroidetes bacterium]|nr:type IX secretion system protein PorQ [Bacteroidota bacterium]MCZ2133619.1 type IX secretion system protein PorQ [Bacteroidota bacterium]